MSTHLLPAPCALLPAPVRERLARVLADLARLTPDEILWSVRLLQALRADPGASAWASAWADATAVASRLGRDEAWWAAWAAADPLWRGGDAEPDPSPAAGDAATAAVVCDVAPDAASVLARPWEAGLILVSWARTAPRAPVEVAASLALTWTGSAHELIEVATNSCVLAD